VEEILLFNKQVFFQLSIHALVARMQPDKVVRRCPDGKFLAIFLCSAFSVSHVQQISDIHSKFALGPQNV